MFLLGKNSYKEKRFSLNYPKYLRVIQLDPTSVTFLDPKKAEGTLTMSRILLNNDDPLNSRSIVDAEQKKGESEALIVERVAYKTVSGIHYQKIIPAPAEDQKVSRINPTSNSVIHRWIIGNEDICFIFTYGFPDEARWHRNWKKQQKILSSMFDSIKTKSERSLDEIEDELKSIETLFPWFKEMRRFEQPLNEKPMTNHSMLNRVTVFCGSSTGTDNLYTSEAFALGQLLAHQKIVLVYGGASIGVMGAVANGCLSKNGNVIGIIPKFLSTKEIAHDRLTELIEVETMHERKLKMHDLADGFIVLPGGIGTLEEFFEILTWAQLGLHQKPIAILNTNNYYDDLLAFIGQMAAKGFLKPIHQKLILVSDKIPELLEKMRNYQAPDLGKFITEETT